jgi:hypothetical protein
MILEVEDKPSIDPASANLTRDALQVVRRPRHKFAILKSPPRFTQTMINRDGSFVVEYSEGAVDNLFEFEPATLEDAGRFATEPLPQHALDGEGFLCELEFHGVVR